MGVPPSQVKGSWTHLQKLLTSWLFREKDWDQRLDEAHLLQQKR